jgi:phosphomannomutase
MERLAAAPPERLGDHEVVGVTDYRRDAEERPRYLPATSLVALDLGTAGRVLVRPSGTEPKLKIYVDLRAEVAPDDDVWQREAQQRAAAAAIGDETAATLGLE